MTPAENDETSTEYPNDITIMKQDSSGKTALHLAYQDKKFWKVNMILRKLSQNPIDTLINYVDNTGLSHFHIACSTNIHELVKNFLESMKIDVNTKINENSKKWPGYTALHIAVENKRMKVIELLLQAGASPNIISSRFNMTVLHHACKIDNRNKRKLEIRWNCALQEHLINSSSDDKNNLQIKIVRSLIQYGADVNARDKNGRTALLHLYNHFNDLHFNDSSKRNAYFTYGDKQHILLDELLKSGADINAEDENGMTIFKILAQLNVDDNPIIWERAISIIFTRRSEKLNDLQKRSCILPLRTHTESERFIDPEQDTKIHNSNIFYDYVWRLKKINRNDEFANFLESGLDMNYTLPNGKNVLIVFFSRCASRGFLVSGDKNVLECRLALEKRYSLNWKLNARDLTGRTALHYAILRRDKHDVSLLLKLGADVEIIDNEGNTPLNCCFQWICQVQFLIICQLMRMQKMNWLLNDRNERGLQIWKRNRFYNYMRYRGSKLNGPGKLKNLRYGRFPSYYELLFKTVNDLLPYVRNTMFVESIERLNLNDDRCYYIGLLRLKLMKCIMRLPLIDPAKESLVLLTKIHLPEICSERIIHFLDYDSLEKLVDTELVCDDGHERCNT